MAAIPVSLHHAFSPSPAPQDLTPLVLVPGIGMMLVGLGFVIFAWRRRLGFGYVAWGALAWVIAVAFKFAWAIPLNPGLYAALTSALPAPLGLLIFEVYVGLLTGIFEVALVWLVLSRIRLGHASWESALAFGIGFGALEAILLGASSLASGLTALGAPEQIPASVAAQMVLANNLLYGIAPILERAATIYIHVLSAGLIFYAIATNQRRFVLVAVVYKTAIDSVAAFSQFWGVNSLERIWTIEAVVIVFGLIGWWGTRWVARRYPAAPPTVPGDSGPVAPA
jgi:uncharacterized membrane protein YhfC